MSYAKRLEEILSDGNWHCILPMIAETGLSARNRISEMNQKNEEEFGFNKYVSEKCTIDHVHENKHKAKLYMYKLNSDKYSLPLTTEELMQSNTAEVDNTGYNVTEYTKDEMQEFETWNNLSKEERKKKIREMMKEKGL